jgi:hypothetical protein
MNSDDMTKTIPEAMGLRLEPTTQVRVIDVVLFSALVVSGLAWVWIGVVGAGPLLAMLDAPAGRFAVAAIGLASVAAVVRAWLLWHWPGSESDHGLV